LSKIIELLGLERFRKENPLAEAAPQVPGVWPCSSHSTPSITTRMPACRRRSGSDPPTRRRWRGCGAATDRSSRCRNHPSRGRRPGPGGAARHRWPGRLPPGWGPPGWGHQAELPGRLRFAIRIAVSLTKPWPSASGRCHTTGIPILCSKRSSRAISPSWLDRLASSGSLPKVSSPPSASSQGSFRGRALGTWISPLTKPAAAAAAGPARQPAAPLRGAAAQGVPPGAGAVPGRGGVGS
jgi:hypothetical protein